MAVDLRHVQTERLSLTVPDPERDLAALVPMFGDPGSWDENPEQRQVDTEQTHRRLVRTAGLWRSEGLASWTARLIDTGEVVGFGGARRQPTRAWNIGYGLAGAWRGQGLASELGRAALAAAASVDDSVPCIAWILPDNAASIRVARRLGLVNQGLRVDPGDLNERVAFADRELSDSYGVPVRSQKNCN